MTYCARYRFKLLSSLQIEKGTPLELTIPGFTAVTFEMGEETYPVGHWVTANPIYSPGNNVFSVLNRWCAQWLLLASGLVPAAVG